MERFAADALTEQRDSYVRQAIRANVAWGTIVEDYGVTLEQVMEIAGYKGSTMIKKPSDDDIKDAASEIQVVHRRAR